jgi:hypothetical protein
MQYMDVVWRSFRISWRHKYLWLIALFSGEGGGSFNFGSGGGGGGGGGGGSQSTGNIDTAAIQDQITRFLTDYAGLIIALVIAWLVLVVVFFILSAICEGATIRASAEHDAERPWGLGMSWRAGLHTVWAIVRFRLLLVALGLPLVLLVIGLAVGIVIAILNQNGGAAVPLILVGILLIVAGIPYAIYLYFLDRLGSRALILEQLGAVASIARGHRLLIKRLGRTLIVWLLSIATSFVLGILTACVLAVVFVPLLIIGGVAAANNSGPTVALILIGAALLIPLSLVVGGFLSAQSATYWTLAFRRLDLDPVPLAPPPPPSPPLAPQPS